MARRLVLLRHGRIAANRDGLWHGSTDSDLLPLGRRQAQRTARFLMQREPEIAAVYASPLQRCQDTAAAFIDLQNRHSQRQARRASVTDWFRERLGAWGPAAPEDPSPPLSIATHHDLREYGIGDWEGMSFADLARDYQFIERACEDLDYAAPGGESLRQVSQRYAAALREIDAHHSEREDVLVVGHGAAFAVALATLINDAPQKWRDYGIDNCGLSELTLGEWPELVSFNHTSHL
ncbi:MAG: histidine phosphatase family protein [Pseudomonadota bacterium]